jgi:hypothetical protein
MPRDWPRLLSQAPTPELLAEAGRRSAALRETRSGGRNGGRPPSTNRCPCGAMTADRAAKRKHVCVETCPECGTPSTDGCACVLALKHFREIAF